ncbi:MAG: Gx transporter family protein [Tissierellales bacterium]|jgi:heptaprenyl diphosphate synthase|nr:Gx transporter family protein [Tissierellales bacterium]
MSAKKLVFFSILIAQAMVLSFIEQLIPLPVAIPGAKLGLANLVTLIVLYKFGFKPAFSILLGRIFLISFLFGNFAMLWYSLAGGLLALLTMALSRKFFSMIGVSILGALMHNVGQVCVAALVIENLKIAYYLPVLLVIAIPTGLFIGITGRYLLSAIDKIKLEL